MAGCVFEPLKQHVFKEFRSVLCVSSPHMSDLVFIHKSKEELEP